MNEKISDPRYTEQQEVLDEIARRLDVVAYRPNYHHARGSKNTVLFYLKEDEAHNRKVDRQPTRYTRGEAADLKKYKGIEISPEYVYRDHFWAFENSNGNGRSDLEYANIGKIALSGTDWKDVLEGHIRLALIRKTQARYIASIGGYLGLREADGVNNDMNRELIKAFKMAHGAEFFGSINFYDEKRKKIVAGDESVYEEYTGQEVYNFYCDFAVPCKDEELEGMIRQWNRGMPNAVVNIDKITERISRLDGIHFIWS